ncbi:hypothetical protein HYPSUDRAFT_688337 [Hypholoma sublateritium FD-334 SS-4]|uniref:Cytochrome P450 n=1 Tax=Hypholoma sublateritium (strain FD-334 SS-4) TaxID=945553 RepID=A0A0D2MDU3_HYPSF|nr:hypothetical protein HYPSUDRAFT_688337 [Hypholoma sublateritium FD-334 SS-4]
MYLPDLLYLSLAYLFKPATLVSIWLIALGWALLHSRSSSRQLPYPPGPAARNMIAGNVLDLPVRFAWNEYIEWGKKYGDILHYRVYNKHTVILHSYDDNVELLDKRSAIYSDRPRIPMLDLMGWTNFNSVLLRYGPKWKQHRRIFQQYFKPEASMKYRSTLGHRKSKRS